MKAMPSNVDAEKFVLGAILVEESLYAEAAALLTCADFTTEAHRRLFIAMGELRKRGDKIDLLTISEECGRKGEIESVGGYSYIMSLGDGMPQLSNIDAWLKVVREKSIFRRVALIGQKIMNRGLMADEGYREVIEGSRSDLMALYDNATEGSTSETAYEIVAEAGGVNAFFTAIHGIKSPWQKVDFYTGGWQTGDLIIMAARPSMGKTAFALNLLWHAAERERKKCVFYSYEMERKSITIRLLSLLTGVPFLDILQGNTTQSERTALRGALDRIEETGFRTIQASGKTTTAIRAHAEKLRAKGLLDIAAIDYIGLVRSSSRGNGNRNRTHELGEIAADLKHLGMDLGIPMIALSQLNRAVEARPDKRPGLSDLRDSGEIEEHADLIGFIHRPGYYKRDDPSLENVAEIIIGKQRNGDTPIVELEFSRRSGKFHEGNRP